MRILIAHNEYREPGGEDAVANAESELLASSGHEVRRVTVANKDVAGLCGTLSTAWRAPYSSPARLKFAAEIAGFAADIVHVHNFFPILTPSIYDACIEAGVPVVQTLHNYRLLCPKATMFRGKKSCELCLSGSPYNAVLYGCYRGSRLQSIIPARMVALNRRRRTWATKVTRFIVLSEFARRKFTEAGFPADRIDVKPNYVVSPATPARASSKRAGALYVGRLSEEKGLGPLLDAWGGLEIPLRIVGDGPMAPMIPLRGNPHITALGAKPQAEVHREMSQASFLAVPSLAYEGFPLVLAEAFACGLPAIVSRHGSLAEIVEDGVTGLHIEPNDPDDLAEKVRWAHAHPKDMARMGANARRIYQRKYTPQANYPLLMAIYDRARQHSRDRRKDARC